jgi:hypothetical protein
MEEGELSLLTNLGSQTNSNNDSDEGTYQM